MHLTRAADYAVRVVAFLAAKDASARVTRDDIVQNTGVPPAFLGKIIQTLAAQGLVSTKSGVHGGCSLRIPASEISILRIVESIDGPIQISACLADASACPQSKSCGLRCVLAQAQQQIAKVLGGTNVADMARGFPALSDPLVGASL